MGTGAEFNKQALEQAQHAPDKVLRAHSINGKMALSRSAPHVAAAQRAPIATTRRLSSH
jgi:hypothetical protein